MATVSPLAVVGDADGQARTEVSFLPRPDFHMIEFNFATLEHRLRELAFLNSASPSTLVDNRHAVEKREEMRYEGWRRGVRENPRPQQDRPSSRPRSAQ